MAETEIVVIAAPSAPVQKMTRRRERRKRNRKTPADKPAQAKKHGKVKPALEHGADVVQRQRPSRLPLPHAAGHRDIIEHCVDGVYHVITHEQFYRADDSTAPRESTPMFHVKCVLAEPNAAAKYFDAGHWRNLTLVSI
ncbi:hypothetical protein SPRG_05414 [Saprolegnia parasitica CBS 223.65]|uniref:Uncharacterized protein n=1 Tax=Saprolegnia parasitica (strain CBS 223.65) TaxID=695850 RepID=A0A067CRQ5_SAPPC|nr:hypothetical protein SPRG_05414 [Saprolegnia parasitica CBS 223.65]KDO29171.1 hypothetical protein SPRG_05414 [Saprolegnia parasitica CBS 223.65]|eukprot:XP_012200049.1 hypothetical protein SPRG_05414 [Saprolegnia parasitica CBS 223.65]